MNTNFNSSMKTFTRQQFETLAARGCIREAANEDYPEEDLCETAMELGIANRYSLQTSAVSMRPGAVARSIRKDSDPRIKRLWIKLTNISSTMLCASPKQFFEQQWQAVLSWRPVLEPRQLKHRWTKHHGVHGIALRWTVNTLTSAETTPRQEFQHWSRYVANPALMRIPNSTSALHPQNQEISYEPQTNNKTV
jgi:hypothetical protein